MSPRAVKAHEAVLGIQARWALAHGQDRPGQVRAGSGLGEPSGDLAEVVGEETRAAALEAIVAIRGRGVADAELSLLDVAFPADPFVR